MKNNIWKGRFANCGKVRAFNTQSGQFVAFGCGQWACPLCRKTLAWKVSERARLGMLEHCPSYFFTVTQPSKIKSSEAAYAIMPHQWDTFRNLIQYQAKKEGINWEYLAVTEGQPQRGNMPHLHIITSINPVSFSYRWQKHARAKDIAAHCGFGFQSDLSIVDSNDPRKLASYISKISNYISKDPIDYNPPKGFRRVRYSQGWPELPAMPKLELSVQKPAESASDWIERTAIDSKLPRFALWAEYRKGMNDLSDYLEYIARELSAGYDALDEINNPLYTDLTDK
jgi:hypothetical protein